MLSLPLRLLFFFLCLKTAFSSSLHASSFSTTQLCPHEEAFALLQFKTSLSFDNSKTESWKEGIDCCSWDGVSCDNVTGHVISLDLSGSFLSGTFPSNSTLFLLKNLQSLNLSFSDFRHSKVPPEISQFTKLKHLDISCSQFSGQVPAEIAHLPKLVSLNLSNCGYLAVADLILETTTLRNLVQNLSEVRELVLYKVNMTSVNPRFFMNLSSSLTTLNLCRSGLRGNFPNNIFHFPNLKFFCLGGSSIEQNLTIDLPSSNWSSSLQHLYLGLMDCRGRLPESIGDLKSLQYLRLDGHLEGSIPTSITKLTQLRSLQLSSNHFSGPIPVSIGNLSQLTLLGLRLNILSGQIPSSLANLTQLSVLDLSGNHFSGPIPFHATRFSKLSTLDLSYNLLNGTLPPWIFTLPLLEYLYLNHNQFQGQINQFQQKSLIQLFLSNNKLQGSIPNSMANLVNLYSLDLSSNHFITLSYNNLSLRMNAHANFTLPKLTNVLLSSCNLSEFPNFLRHSDGLRSLVLSKSSIPGNIPEWICEMDDLEILDLSHNNLSGKIPNCLPMSLSVLNLQANYFDGIISFGFPKGCGLRNLNLHGNQMDGPLPRSLVNCDELEVLDVGNNNIEDTFPHWLESLPDLQVLVLRSNKFHSSVQGTKESLSFPKLRVLDLSNNDFLGPLPIRYMENFKAMMDSHGEDGSPEYMMVPTLTGSYQYSLVVTWKGFDYELQGILTIFSSIHLSNNKFEGEIPDVIGKLSSLKGLNLSHNNFTGHIPPSLGNLMNLEWLDLSSNKLTGKIPDELVSLIQLSVLNLSNNLLVGHIPQGNQFNTFGNDSYEGNLGLCGFPLSKSCNGIGTPPTSFQEKAEFWRFGWRVVVLGYGCGVVFGLLMGYHVFRTGKPKCGAYMRSLSEENNDLDGDHGDVFGLDLESLKILLKRGVFNGAMLCCLLVFACKRGLVVEGVVNAGYGVIEQWALLLRNAWPKGTTLDTIQQSNETKNPSLGEANNQLTCVMKFGRSSVTSAERIRDVAAVILSFPNDRPVIVLSAVGNTTNNFLLAGEKAVSRGITNVETMNEFSFIKDLHLWTAGKIGTASKGNCYDERVNPTNARLLTMAKRLNDDWLSDPAILVVTGFLTLLGKDWRSSAITTLGRGGSDLTVTTIGKALGLREIQVWKDVDGVLTCDPNINLRAEPVPYLTFKEAAELSYCGAKVLHPLSMRPDMEGDIPVKIKNSYNPTAPGTLIKRDRDMMLTSIVLKRNVTMLDIVSTRMLGQYGFLAKVFSIFEDLGISLDVVATSEELNHLVEELKKIAVVNLLSAPMHYSSNWKCPEAFCVLRTNGVSVQMISQGASKVNISLIVNDNEAEQCVRALHTAFFESDTSEAAA
ncbi:hypothetical protein SLEP1_g35386 [Rubroshorea leprosula]|uniref:aspartate kinase n=1 Tax=Rubroshorea leprosula TaxID=152421 RepID=A0AAV5KN13_9ROSI|nr:hypothetical protein SLEP1_g35386 [Rubroshorea leprosula]